MTSGTATARATRWLELALAIAGASLSAFLLFHLVLFRFGMDQAIFAVVGDGLLHGELPYRDRFELRTPGIYLFYAAGQLLFGKTQTAIRLLEATALLSLFVAFPYFSRRHVGSAVPGFVGAVLATLIHVRMEYWHTAQSESFGGVVLAWAVLFATWQPQGRRRQLAAWAAAGALFTFAALFKPPLGGGFVLALALLLARAHRARRRQPAGAWHQPILAFGLAGGLVLAAALLPFVVSGALSELVWTYRDVVPGYVTTQFEAGDLPAGIYRAIRFLLFNLSPYLFPGLVLWAVLPPLAPGEREGVFYLTAAVAPQLLGIALQARYFPYHSGAMVHLMALWSAWGYFKLWRRVRHRPVWALVLVAALVAVHDAVPYPGRVFVTRPEFWSRCGARWQALTDPDQRARIEDRLHSAGPHHAATIRKAAAWLRSNTPPEARILVWGRQSAIYFESDRRPASRFITNSALMFSWSTGRARKLLRQDLETEPPAAIVVANDDRRPFTGYRFDDAKLLKRIAWLNKMLDLRYRRVGRFGKLTIYRRRADQREVPGDEIQARIAP